MAFVSHVMSLRALLCTSPFSSATRPTVITVQPNSHKGNPGFVQPQPEALVCEALDTLAPKGGRSLWTPHVSEMREGLQVDEMGAGQEKPRDRLHLVQAMTKQPLPSTHPESSCGETERTRTGSTRSNGSYNIPPPSCHHHSLTPSGHAVWPRRWNQDSVRWLQVQAWSLQRYGP